ncbi:MAG: TldD/PmbA family protein [DPANN group archaeon]|nr:TldD/PmbA family protein [DPANN group archaeon]
MIEVIEKTIRKYKGVPLEFFGSSNKSMSIEMKMDKISSSEMSVSKGIGVKAIVGGRAGFSYNSDIYSVEDAVKSAMINAKHSELKQDSFPIAQKMKDIEGIYDYRIRSMNPEELVSLSVKLRDKLKERNNSLKVNDSVFEAGSSDDFLVNSNGVSYTSKYTGISGMVEAVYKNSSGGASMGAPTIKGFNIDYLSEKAARLAVSGVGRKKIRSGKQMVLIDSDVLESLFESTLYPSINADMVQKGQSTLKGKIGQQIGSSGFDIIDSGRIESGLCSSAFDRDGTKSQETSIMSSGILKGFIYDYVTAMCDGKKSTGNASGGFGSMASISPTNVLLKYSELMKFDNMISGIKDGIIIYEVLGAHTANHITGDFSLSINKGFKIIDGEVAYPVKNAMFAGNVFELLKSVSCFGDDVRQSGHLIAPTIAFSGQKIVG